MVKSEKNESLLTPLYTYTTDGVILALLCSYYNNAHNDNKLEAIRNKIFEMIFEFYSKYESYIVDFVSRIYAKAKQKGYSHSIVVLLLRILMNSNFPIRFMKDALNWTLYFHLEKEQQTKKEFYNIYIETLNELDEHKRKIILYHEKAEIESRFHLYQPPKDWEEMWIKNIRDHSKIVLYGICQNKVCLNRYPVLVDYYNYRTEMSSKGHLNRDCNKCNTRDSIYVYNTLEEKEIQSKLV
jgi:hypothetical protein